jgi:hypothetical protein
MRVPPATILGFAFSCHLLSGASTITGPSIVGSPGLLSGKTGVYVVSNDGSPLSGVDSLEAGVPFQIGQSFQGGSFTIIGSAVTNLLFGNTVFLPSGLTVDEAALGGLSFGVLVFDTSSSETLAGDSFQVWTDPSWVIPTSSGTYSFSSTPAEGSPFLQLVDAADGSGTVRPAVVLPILAIVIASGTDAQISFTTANDGLTYQLQKRGSLTSGSWSDVAGQSATGDGLAQTLTDVGALPGETTNFYRVTVN